MILARPGGGAGAGDLPRHDQKEDFEFSKGLPRPRPTQVRLYDAIARHTMLVMAALAACAVTAA
jgi:hypothetical protein